MQTAKLLKEFKKRQHSNSRKGSVSGTQKVSHQSRVPALSKPSTKIKQGTFESAPAAPPAPPPAAPPAAAPVLFTHDVNQNNEIDWGEWSECESEGVTDQVSGERSTNCALNEYFERLKTQPSTFKTEQPSVWRAVRYDDFCASPDSPLQLSSGWRLREGWWESFLQERKKRVEELATVDSMTETAPLPEQLPERPPEQPELASDRLQSLQSRRAAEKRARAEERERVNREGGGVLFPDAMELELLGFGP